MTPWTRGVLVGLAAGLLIAALTGGTHFETFLRVGVAGQYLLDTRVDESAVRRIVNIPVASLGEASLLKRSWIVGTTYAFTLQVRPEVSSGPERALSGVVVNVRLPGRVLSTNATRVAAGTAVWETLPAEALQVRTLAIHWISVVILAAALAMGTGLRRS